MAKKYRTNVAIFDDKGKITEAFVQRVIKDKLNKQFYSAPKVYCEEEVYTTEGKKADVLLAFNRLGGSTYICAVEAKSKRTLNALKPDSSDVRQLWWARGIVILISFVALLAYGRVLVLDLLECFILLAGIFSAVYLITKLLDRTGGFPFLELPVLDQLDQYPANENWVAVPSDVFESPGEMETLLKYCKRQGVGLLVVSADAAVKSLALPHPRNVGNDYTSKYKKRTEIVAATRSGSSFRSPFEKLQNRRRFGYFALIMIVFSLMAWVLGTNGERRPEPVNSPPAPWPFTDPTPYAEAFQPTVPLPPTGSVDADNEAPVTPSPPETKRAPPTAPPPVPPTNTRGQTPTANRPASSPAYKPPRKPTNAPSPPGLPACDIWQPFDQQFIVYDKLFRAQQDAQQRLNLLHRLAYTDFFIVSTNCFDDWMPPDHFLLVLPTVYPTRNEADRFARNLKADLVSRGVTHGRIRTLMLNPLTRAK